MYGSQQTVCGRIYTFCSWSPVRSNSLLRVSDLLGSCAFLLSNNE